MSGELAPLFVAMGGKFGFFQWIDFFYLNHGIPLRGSRKKASLVTVHIPTALASPCCSTVFAGCHELYRSSISRHFLPSWLTGKFCGTNVKYHILYIVKKSSPNFPTLLNHNIDPQWLKFGSWWRRGPVAKVRLPPPEASSSQRVPSGKDRMYRNV